MILLYWYIFIFISTESLSYLHLLERKYILLTEFIFLTAFLFSFRKAILKTLPNINFRSKSLLIILALLLLTFFQGFFSAPNTTDSMVYHLPRVMYWMQEHTLHQDVIRNVHDFMALFAEYILLHLYFIFNGDRMLFLSQWLAFAFTIILSFLIANQLGIGERGVKYITLLVASLPIGVMQATSTQTDMITTVLILFSIYLVLLLKNNPNIKNSLLFGFAIGLGLLTKATFILFVPIPLGILFILIVKKWPHYLFSLLLSLLIIGITQIRFLHQNWRLYGNITGQKVIEGKSYYVNELINVPVILSNLVRNIFLHLPVPIATKPVQDALIAFHKTLGLGINDQRTTYADTKFSVLPVIFPQEDIVGNPIHLTIVFLAGGVLISLILRRRQREIKTLKVYSYLLTLASLVIFSTILKWQPFHSRLQMPFFVVGSISSIAILFPLQKLRDILNYLAFFSVVFSLLLIILNTSRPLISYSAFYPYIKSFAPPLSDIPQSFFTRDRDRQYFTPRYYWYYPYKNVVRILSEKRLKAETISFNLMDGFEYPLWMFLKKYNLNFRVIPESKISNDTIIISTSQYPYSMKGYNSHCIKTKIDYGYACILKRKV